MSRTSATRTTTRPRAVAASVLAALLAGPAVPGPADAAEAPTLTLQPDDSRLALAWTATPGADAYRVTRDGATATTLDGDTLSWVDPGVENGTRHTYAVTALAAGTPLAVTAPVTGTPVDIRPPVVEGGAVVQVLDGGFAVRWSASTATDEPVHYRFYADGRLAGVSATTAAHGTFTVAGLSSTVADLAVEAVDALGNATPLWRDRHPAWDYEPPAVPLRLRATACSGEGVHLAWDTLSGGATGDAAVAFRVYRDGKLVESTAERTYAVSGLTVGVPTRLTVRAVDRGGMESRDSYTLEVTPLTATASSYDSSSGTDDCLVSAPDPLARPSAPSVDLGRGALLRQGAVAWVASTDQARRLAGYRVLVDDRAVRTGSLRGGEYVAVPLAQAGSSPRIAVEVVDLHGQTSPRSVLTPTVVPSFAPAVPTGLTVTREADGAATVAWPATDGAGAYDVEVDGRPHVTTASPTVALTPTSGASVRTVRVTAVDADGRRSRPSAPLFVTTA